MGWQYFLKFRMLLDTKFVNASGTPLEAMTRDMVEWNVTWCEMSRPHSICFLKQCFTRVYYGYTSKIAELFLALCFTFGSSNSFSIDFKLQIVHVCISSSVIDF